MSEKLDVYLYGSLAATLRHDGPSTYTLTYDRAWQQSGGIPLSMALPVTQLNHSGRVVVDFLDNLLPDSVSLREQWAQQSGLSDTEPYGLLAVHGADVAGALEFYPSGESPRSAASHKPLSDSEVALRIRAIRENRPLPTSEGDAPGQFSLGGAQGKFALALRSGQWVEPSGTFPSTHIFKPQVAGLPDAEIVEHITMTSLQLLGMRAAETEIARFENEHTLQVRRFDRFEHNGAIARIHQEDLSQALAVPRLRKYERDGGPNYRAILAVLGKIPDPGAAAHAKDRFVKSLIFSWLVLNTDAHAKNFSVQLLPDGSMGLAPMYDVSSFLAYVRPRGPRSEDTLAAFDGTKLSMRVADSFEAGAMTAFEWSSVARDAHLDPSAIIDWANELTRAIADVFDAVARSLDPQFQTEVVDLLVERVGQRARQVERTLKRGSRL